MIKKPESLYNQVYVDTGDGQPVILLHGLFGNVAMWRQTINALQQSYRVIVPRLPLFEVPLHLANVNYLLEVIHDFLDWHQLTDVTFIGTDIGGQIALCYAHQHPERVRRIVLSGSSGLFENLPVAEKEYDKDFDSVHQQVKDAFFKKDLATPNLIVKVFKTVNTSSKGLHITSLARSSRKTDIARFLHKLEVPVLLIWGLQDKITPPEVALHFHDLLRYGTVQFVDACGHLPMVEHPALYVKHIRTFLEG